MQKTPHKPPLGHLWNSIQSWLFPMLEDEIGALDEKHRQFVAVCELCAPQDHMAAYRWCGYKLHLDVIDGDIPVSAILTSASLHDSQVAIPLAQMSAGRIVHLYDLADAAYDAREIREMSARLGHVAIIDDNPGQPRPARRWLSRCS